MVPADRPDVLAGRTLLFFVTEDFYFESHRLPLALAARDAGLRVVLVTRCGERSAHLRQLGIEVIPLEIERGSVNLVRDLALLCRLCGIYRQVRPDVVHHVAMKPVIYGSLAARVTGIHRVVNALAGLGFVFSSSAPKARLLRPIVRLLLRFVLAAPGSRLILQNRDDQAMFPREGLCPMEQIRLVPGVGVDLQRFIVQPEPEGRVRIVLPARMLADKGVVEFVEAARMLRERGLEAECVLVGGTDSQNPAAISEKQLRSWHDAGLVSWIGHCADMPSSLAACHIVCLPSYREGLPKALLEACASGRPIVTTDVPGCRDVVRDEVNGLLARVRDAADLADKLARLVTDPELRRRMGAAGRVSAELNFSSARSAEQTLDIYRELI
ncbi:glycosyltransferase family 4 protein [Methyloversatilis discipulorum]|jgi:glycosyltransferase involved in cell wall biosynthesis|uniref:glycosyltransferase family 4 protein n=1 Tax=Methyloversatilis discipulorum TaxID=1119528 RepID=UPI003AF8D384